MLSTTRSLRTPAIPTKVRALTFSTLQSPIPFTGKSNAPHSSRAGYNVSKLQARRMSSSDYSVLALEARLAKWAKENPPKNPSKRTPTRDIRFNIADRVEKDMIEAGFRSWGFAIYRCTYQSDSDWAEFLRRHRWYIADGLESVNGLDLLDTLESTVFENRERFEGASTATIREHFQTWATTAVQEEQGVSPEMLRYANIKAPRYRYCLFVDEESLQSVVQTPLDRYPAKSVFVNMLKGWWKPESLEDYSAEEIEEFGPDGLLDDGYDTIDGYTVKDVGWMKVAFQSAGLPGFYAMGEWDEWERVYERPREICHNIWD